MQRRPRNGERSGRGSGGRRAAALVAAWAVVWAGCNGSNGNGTPTARCGVVDPETGEVPACGVDQWCVCSTGECAVADGACATGYRLAPAGALCLSPAQAAGLVRSTPEERPLCVEPDGGPDVEPDAGPDDGADADGDEDDAVVREDVAVPDDVAEGDGEAGAPIELVIFAREEMYAAPTDRRRISREMGFPVAQDFQRITVRLRVYTGCPTHCDPLARVATVRLGVEGGGELELLRAVTPFGGGAEWTEDVTDLAPLFTWSHPVSVTLDTAEGAWEVDLSIVFEPGPPPREVRQVVPLFDQVDYRTASDIAALLVRMPVGVTSAAVRYRFTGHSTTGTGCDETCERTASISIDGTPRLELSPWRTDCASFVAASPLGDPAVVSLARAGWCPGDLVRTGVSDVSPWLTGLDLVFDMEIPEVDPTTGTWRVSAALVLYR